MKKSIDFNKKAFAHYMALYPVNEIRVHVIVLVLLGTDVFVLLPAFANPFRSLYVYIVTPPVIFLNLWAIWIAINPRKRQLQYTLFRGVFLPYKVNDYVTTEALHIGNHSPEYIREVYRVLSEVKRFGGNQADAVAALQNIRERLLDGSLKLNQPK
ncbi:AHH domain-containing protein [Bacillus sp. SH5-2]|uniref:AHH domain-containing protein n=1 Tax=Bacillus sp. SH5-2 TaxID=2217834 RepID=UPI0011EEED23|nr:hypothetical protein DN410_10430 [Bacillus sp. SH5-2]